ncbi:hypothetical protein XI09_42505 [Bradyrhizobium sp. CCBAU 11386]|uniref:caspase family protein n=1 Tax=Bradyrhizobium sp. CCBAU 11386 TaxID=1630837 RepID=UPI002302E5D9|nr:caspase family protein [Bradyrhizobium sp. CCBAU 11386]MDA9511214.1 hypothetical protein [Bradyrhizobium sp. CCBAU 11386]
MPSPLFVAIGVHKAATMPQLDGVLTSVDLFSTWAASQGYEVIKIDDANERVTVARIKDELTPISAVTGQVDPKRLLDRPRIIVYFCGHGIHAAQDQYWVLSAGPKQPNERISRIGFRDILATYGPKQIAIFSDACRSPLVVQGLASSVVDAYEGDAKPIQKDNFFSSQDGEQSFAVPSKNGKAAYCIFSNVLIRALSPPEDSEALDQTYLETGRRIVSSQSLADYLESKVPEAALDVQRWQVPQCDAGFRPKINDYVIFGKVGEASGRFDTGTRARKTEAQRKEARTTAQLRRIANSRSEWKGPYVAELQPLIGPVVRDYPQAPLLLSSATDIPHVHAPSFNTSAPIGNDLIERHPSGPRWNTFALFERPYTATSRSGVALIQMEDLFTTLPLHRRLWCTALINKGDAAGIELLAWGAEYPSPGTELTAAEALKGLSAGTLSAEDMSILAEGIRYAKHADPLYGVVAAYLYNAVGDVENIRRMCYYYQRHDQDVPFDIAMLAQVELKRRRDGGFRIEVPAVAETPKSRRRFRSASFVWEKTPETAIDVAGITPLLRAGWQHIEKSRHDVHRKCWELTGKLTPSPISTFEGDDVGESLLEILREL